MTDFIGTAGNDTANAVTGDFSGFSGGTITDLQDGTGDFINGFFGEDFIFAGDAADLIYGGEGHDIVNGGGGNDTVYAYTEADPGGSFTGDDISGNLGNDSIFGSSGDDTLAGDSGTDQLFGNDGADILQGGEDWDTLDGGAGADQMSGGLGDDTYYVDRKADQVIEAAGEGYDVVHTTVSFTAGVGIEEVNLEGTGKISAVGNGLVNYLLGNDNANALYGLAGNDILIGGEGVDQMFGGRGDDNTMWISRQARLSRPPDKATTRSLLLPFPALRSIRCLRMSRTCFLAAV
jgi:Ca2+-binding RTX toxin-like protein